MRSNTKVCYHLKEHLNITLFYGTCAHLHKLHKCFALTSYSINWKFLCYYYYSLQTYIVWHIVIEKWFYGNLKFSKTRYGKKQRKKLYTCLAELRTRAISPSFYRYCERVLRWIWFIFGTNERRISNVSPKFEKNSSLFRTRRIYVER